MADRPIPPPPPVTMENIMAMMRTQAELHHESMMKMQQENMNAMNEVKRKADEDNAAQREAYERANKERDDRRSWERFAKFAPLPFIVAYDPLDADGWITELEKVHIILKCTEEEKVDTVVHLLQGPAATWWKVEVKKKRDGKHTWGQFKKLFFDHHFPITKKIEYVEQFLQLKQAGKTVAEYEIEFSSLARFVPQFTTEDVDRAARFQQGLHNSIEKLVVGINPTTYADTLACAMHIQAIEMKEKKVNERKRQKQEQQGGFSKKPFTQRYGQSSGSNQRTFRKNANFAPRNN